MRPTDSGLERRAFLKALGLTGAGVLFGSPLARVLGAEGRGGMLQVPKRKFGRHDIEVASLAVGGHALGVAGEKEGAKILDFAEECGATFLDNAWDYHGGASEEIMGRLIEKRRDRFFLMTKVCTHDDAANYDLAMRMLEESLRRLRTDHLDLWMWHAVATQDQVRLGFESGGVVQALADAKKQGKTRFVGFTGHTSPDVHLAVLGHKFPFDACLLPLSPIEANSNAFVRRVLPELVAQGIAPLAMKTMGGNGRSIQDGVLSVDEALRYALSLPVSTLVTGAKSLSEFRTNAGIAAAFQPMTPDAMLALEDRCSDAHKSNLYEMYRRWSDYRDGDAAMTGHV